MLWTQIALFIALAVTGGAAPVQALFADLSTYDPKALAIVANRDSSDLTIIDTATNAVIGRVALPPFSRPHMAMVTHDGKKILVSATGRDRFIVVDLATLAIERMIETGRAPEHFDITRDNRWAYVGNMEDSTVSMIDLDTGKEIKRVAGFVEPHGFSVVPGDAKVYVSNFGAHEVGVLEAPSLRVARRLAVGEAHRAGTRKPERFQSELKGIAHPTLTMDGAYAYAADGDSGMVAVIDTRTDQVVTTLTVGKAPWRAYASPDGQWMLVPNNGDRTVSAINTATRKVAATLRGGPEMTGINYALGGTKAYIISRGESAVYIYDMRTLRLITRLKIGAGLAPEVASTTADGKKIYLASSSDDAVYVIDATTDRVTRIADVGHHPWGVTILGSASPDYCH